MPKPPFDSVDIFKDERFYKKKDGRKKRVNGLDTETYKGKAKLIADGEGNYIEPRDFSDILSFLTASNYRSCANFFYNITYDFQSLIKFLPRSAIEELWEENEIIVSNEGEDYKLYYLPRKIFSIQDIGKKHSYRFFDVGNFLIGGLNKNAEKYLKIKKNDEELGISSERIGNEKGYYELYRDRIIKYCVNDAYLTQRLGELLQDWFHGTVGFYPSNFISKASISKEYFARNCYIPSIQKIPLEAIRYAYESFYGARFEILKRGSFFKELWKYDLTSAYPATIRSLISIENGEWERVKERNSGFYGFYKVKVSSYNNKNYGYFPLRINNLITFANGEYETYINSVEYDAFHKEKRLDIEIIDGWEYTPEKLIMPFRDSIDHLFEIKNTAEPTSSEYWSAKILMNSFFGANFEKHSYKYEDENGQIKTRWSTGRFFNPFFASIITAQTRAQVVKDTAVEMDKVCAFCADGMITSGKIRGLKLEENKLGGWKQEKMKEDGHIIMSGVYQIGNENQTRGVKLPFQKELKRKKTWREVLEEHSKEVEIPMRYLKNWLIGEILKQEERHPFSDLNLLEEMNKKINLNGDRKRLWDRDFENARDFLNSNVNSHALYVQQ